ncbi:hypothetical protein [Rheinheimera sp. A13L]|uniref:hypothetical protein n=1 Tax=Rheinheimera sp. A13L TaxID=506534 RepID=UPI0002DB9E43|nr:hypothetical protein [Rheinheimera sp. A13L]
MARYLVSIHSPNNYDPFLSENKAMSLTIDQLNDEMKAAGIRIFVGGLHPLSSAKFPVVCFIRGSRINYLSFI